MTTNPFDTVRYGLRSRLANEEIDELAPDGTVIKSIQTPHPTGWLTVPGYLASSDDLMVTLFRVDSLIDQTDIRFGISLYRQGVEISRVTLPAGELRASLSEQLSTTRWVCGSNYSRKGTQTRQ